MSTYEDTLFLYAESSIHAGTGTGLGAVDLPIQRERHSNYPIIQGSGVKGALRTNFGGDDDHKILLFGKEPSEVYSDENENKKLDDKCSDVDFASAMMVGDARLALFPVRSLNGVFVYATCREVLARIKRDVHNALDLPKAIKMNDEDGNEKEEKVLSSSVAPLLGGRSIMLEDFGFDASVSDDLLEWGKFFALNALPQGSEYDYWRERVQTHLVMLSETTFRDFVTYSTEVVTRIRIDNTTKTVQKGALFTQELLPADTLLYAPVQITNSRTKKMKVQSNDLANSLHEGTPQRFQIGGDETVGRGRVALRWQEA